MSETGLKTWWMEDADFFPTSFLGLRQPDQGFFLAVEGQSTDDGKVLVNTLQDQEEIAYVAGVVRSYELSNIVQHAKVTLRSKDFKEFASSDETEHGVAIWNIDEDTSFVAIFGTQRSSRLTDKGLEWLGETNLTYDDMKIGVGEVSRAALPPGLVPSSAPKIKV